MQKHLYSLAALTLCLSSCNKNTKQNDNAQQEEKPAISYSTDSTPRLDSAHVKNPSEILIPSSELPAGLSWSDSRISTDATHHVWSDYSLRWDWQKQSSLTFHRSIPWMNPNEARAKFKFSQPVNNCFTVWIYNETPHKDGKLRFSFGSGDKEVCHFFFNLDFTGWRTAWVSYDRDMQGEKPNAALDYVKIEAPQNIENGTLWVGDTIAHKFIDARHQHGDYQVPFVHGSDKLTTGHWDPIMHLYDLGKQNTNEGEISPEQKAAMATIGKRIQLSERPQALQDKVLKQLEKQFSAYQIVKDDKGIRGVHIYMEHQDVGSPDDIEHFKAHRLQFACDLLLNLARVYNRIPAADRESAEAKRVAEMFCLLTEHMLDQGYTAGSSLGTMHHFGYRTRSWVPAIAAMQEPLAKAGLLEQARETLAWYYNSNRVFGPVEDKANMDYLNTLSQADFTIQMIGEDNAAKAARLRRYSNWISETLTSDSPGTTSGFKPDGSLFHHSMHYHGYGVPAINQVSQNVVQVLDGTPFEVTPEAYEILKRAYLAANYWGYPFCGFNACGRHPIAHDLSSSKGALHALARSRPGTDEVDEELAACYLEMFGGDSVKLFGKAISPSRTQGFHVMNYNAGGSYKWGDTTVQLKGFGDGIRSHETYKDANRFGRYFSFGSIQIFKTTTAHKSGQENPGWNWTHIPGTTSLILPFDKLEGDQSFYAWAPGQKNFPSGSGKLGTDFAGFLFQLDPSKDDQSLRMRKSVFVFDRELICLGSGISNKSTTYPTVTNLFQTEIPKKAKDLSSEGEGWLIDPYGTGYSIPNKQKVVHTTGEQISPDESSRKPTKGNFSTAWIEHGTCPDNASYQYHIVLDATPELMAKWQKNHAEDYEVLQQDDTAHVIINRPKGIEATAAFAPYKSNGGTTILSTDRSCITLASHMDDGRLQLSVTDIDLPKAGKAPKSPDTFITIEGRWKLGSSTGDKGIKVEYYDTTTQLSITTWRGESSEMLLLPLTD